MSKALSVAKFLLELAEREDEPDRLSHLRLQKLLYYTQGWSLALRDKALFKDRIEAWAHGPVVKKLYGASPITGTELFPVPISSLLGGARFQERNTWNLCGAPIRNFLRQAFEKCPIAKSRGKIPGDH